MKKITALLVALVMLCTLLCACMDAAKNSKAVEFKTDVIDILDAVAAQDYAKVYSVLSDEKQDAALLTHLSQFTGTMTLKTEGLKAQGMEVLPASSLDMTMLQNGDKNHSKISIDLGGTKSELSVYTVGSEVRISDGKTVKTLPMPTELTDGEQMDDSQKVVALWAGALSAAVKAIPEKCIDIADKSMTITIGAEELSAAVEAFIAEGEKNGLKDFAKKTEDEEAWDDICSDARDIDEESVLEIKTSESELGYSFIMSYGDESVSITPRVKESDANVVQYVAEEKGEKNSSAVFAEVTTVKTETSEGKKYSFIDDGRAIITFSNVKYTSDGDIKDKNVYTLELAATDGTVKFELWNGTDSESRSVIHIDLVATEDVKFSIHGTDNKGDFDGKISMNGTDLLDVKAKTVSTDKSFKSDITITDATGSLEGSVTVSIATDTSKKPEITVPESEGTLDEEGLTEMLEEVFGGLLGMGGEGEPDVQL